MNPKADNAWQYLRSSLRYGGENEVLPIVLKLNEIIHLFTFVFALQFCF
jgi:hypothetical protein